MARNRVAYRASLHAVPRSTVITMRRLRLPYAALLLLTASFPTFAQPLDGNPASGRAVAARLCSSCHPILPNSPSAKADPLSFQSIADEPSTTGIALNVFLHSNHNNMPDFILSGAESDDVISYILSLKKK